MAVNRLRADTGLQTIKRAECGQEQPVEHVLILSFSIERGKMKRLVTATSLLIMATSVFADEMWLGQWLEINEPLVRSYLLSLKPSLVGKTIPGTKLSDGHQELQGYRYIANLSAPDRGLYMYEFQYEYKGNKFEAHFIWVKKGFPEHELNASPSCPGKWIEPGGWGILSGDQYTYQAVLPGENIVVTTCQLSGFEK